jgi:7-cyano-7-deazaguanine synthase in queuosine biosynthesis
MKLTKAEGAGRDEVHHVLWTGGWDSSYRVLDLVLVQHRAVQPHYVLDPGRRSARTEIRTIERIRSAVCARDAEAGRRLRQPSIVKLPDIRSNAAVTAAYQAVRAKNHLGIQYEWLARLAEQEGLANLELGVHKDDRFARLQKQADFTAAFRRFSLPLLNVSKLDMKDAAAREGFLDILELSWFCHLPVRGQPCGKCIPCRQTIEEGMGYRVPSLGGFDRMITANALRLRDGVMRRLTAGHPLGGHATGRQRAR